MADRIVEDEVMDVPEIPELLETVLVAALKEGREKLEAGEEVVPFTALAVKDKLFIETHPGDDVDVCFGSAQRTVQGAKGADAYAFCYDGYVDTDAGTLDVLIAEGGIPGEPEGFAIGYLYEESEESAPKVTSDPIYIGPAPNFMLFAVDGEDDAAEDEDADEDVWEDEADDAEAAAEE